MKYKAEVGVADRIGALTDKVELLEQEAIINKNVHRDMKTDMGHMSIAFRHLKDNVEHNADRVSTLEGQIGLFNDEIQYLKGDIQHNEDEIRQIKKKMRWLWAVFATLTAISIFLLAVWIAG